MKHIIALVCLLSITQAFGAKFKRQEWTDKLSARLPQVLCEPKGYFMSCFATELDSCEAEVRKHLTNCVGRNLPPKSIDTKENGPLWADKIGRCTGDATEKALRKIKPLPADCSDIKKWL